MRLIRLSICKVLVFLDVGVQYVGEFWIWFGGGLVDQCDIVNVLDQVGVGVFVQVFYYVGVLFSGGGIDFYFDQFVVFKVVFQFFQKGFCEVFVIGNQYWFEVVIDMVQVFFVLLV